MEVVGSEIGHKMRSAIKAKLTELGCYVDDELPDYVMVMVANKRTRAQMEDDLQLFLGDNTVLFVNWLHQVLKKLQEVTVTAPKPSEPEKAEVKERSTSKERKSKEKKVKVSKSKKTEAKKSKKKVKDKAKSIQKKEQKKAHKKKKSKKEEMIRPNIPPLLMNMEKDSEPSITDVFAGQILKNHGILLETLTEGPKETKPIAKETKRPILPIIDPATILSEPSEVTDSNSQESRLSVSSTGQPKEQQLKEINEIEAKIQGLKQKLAEQLDSMSEDEDFLNIRTEAEELMNDFAEDVFQEISQQTPIVSTPPVPLRVPTPPKSPPRQNQPTEPKNPEILPQIELNLPKRPIRERLGIREEPKKTPEMKDQEDPKTNTTPKSPESFTPERELEPRPNKSAKSRLGEVTEPKRKSISEESSEVTDSSNKRLSSRVSVLERGSRSCASVVRVRPRPRAPAPSSLLMRAVADAHKSLLNIPPKVDKEPAIKRALVLPMRRCVDAQKIVIQVASDNRDDDNQDAISLGDPESEDEKSSKDGRELEKEYVPTPITKKIRNTDYIPSRRPERTSTRKDDTLIIETLNIHNPSVDRDKSTQFIVTMDGFNPNAFLAKKLQTEGLLNEEDEIVQNKPEKATEIPEKVPEIVEPTKEIEQKDKLNETVESTQAEEKKITDTSKTNEVVAMETPVVIKQEKPEKRKMEAVESIKQESPPIKKRKSSPIVFDVEKRKETKVQSGKEEKVREERARTESVGSDNHVVVTTTMSSHKYDAIPPLTSSEKKAVWCRSFPQCRYGAACAFQHPRCKFAAACTRRGCVYAHAPAHEPAIASHVVPAANYKTISAAPLPAMCKFYPACVNPACHFYHPKPCRYGKNCANKLECNFYHADVPKWRYNV